ncbi:chemotaxis protein CheB [Marinimicrobium alkaliphilum]|uniref:chemotaxis protein CheB n=1 Tax=Marinimicrobium alkaliphilum TaxID=2202654 RepID=UPI00130088E7|nr:chemotaxis protein CheB [Marinimicrobium alkaliphilum]
MRIGILTDSADKLPALRACVTGAGHKVAVTGCGLLQRPSAQVDAWVVDASLNLSTAGDFDDWLLDAGVPVFFSDDCSTPGSPEHQAWLRRLTEKLRRLDGALELQRVRPARYIWLLGASTGGPSAVRDFMAQVPIGLDVAFIYAQHIDVGQNRVLAKMLASAGAYRVCTAAEGMVVEPDSLILLDADRQVELQENGTLSFTGGTWAGTYAPSIDQLGNNLAHTWGSHAGLLVFSGMGDDGASASRLLHRRGGQVWVQAPESCIIPSMPDSVLAATQVHRCAPPIALGQAFAESLTTRQMHNERTQHQGS